MIDNEKFHELIVGELSSLPEHEIKDIGISCFKEYIYDVMANFCIVLADTRILGNLLKSPLELSRNMTLFSKMHNTFLDLEIRIDIGYISPELSIRRDLTLNTIEYKFRWLDDYGVHQVAPIIIKDADKHNTLQGVTAILTSAVCRSKEWDNDDSTARLESIAEYFMVTSTSMKPMPTNTNCRPRYPELKKLSMIAARLIVEVYDAGLIPGTFEDAFDIIANISSITYSIPFEGALDVSMYVGPYHFYVLVVLQEEASYRAYIRESEDVYRTFDGDDRPIDVVLSELVETAKVGLSNHQQKEKKSMLDYVKQEK